LIGCECMGVIVAFVLGSLLLYWLTNDEKGRRR